mmetsp:Transcript_74003/g.149696  ORF Transcript_74003/g.149696 Transcript_74003/m.149696 type:complete len:364 (+) Transcript_74003:1141-2232(+)
MWMAPEEPSPAVAEFHAPKNGSPANANANRNPIMYSALRADLVGRGSTTPGTRSASSYVGGARPRLNPTPAAGTEGATGGFIAGTEGADAMGSDKGGMLVVGAAWVLVAGGDRNRKLQGLDAAAAVLAADAPLTGAGTGAGTVVGTAEGMGTADTGGAAGAAWDTTGGDTKPARPSKPAEASSADSVDGSSSSTSPRMSMSLSSKSETMEAPPAVGTGSGAEVEGATRSATGSTKSSAAAPAPTPAPAPAAARPSTVDAELSQPISSLWNDTVSSSRTVAASSAKSEPPTTVVGVALLEMADAAPARAHDVMLPSGDSGRRFVMGDEATVVVPSESDEAPDPDDTDGVSSCDSRRSCSCLAAS